jgi:hypothetical protein
MLRLISKKFQKISFSKLLFFFNYSLNWFQFFHMFLWHIINVTTQINPKFQHQLKLPFLNMKYYTVLIIILVHICMFGPTHLVESNINTLSLMILAISLMKSPMDYIFLQNPPLHHLVNFLRSWPPCLSFQLPTYIFMGFSTWL